MPRTRYTPPTPPSPRDYYNDDDDPWQYATEYDYIHRNDNVAAIPVEGVAFHVHNVFDNLKENMEEIMTTLGGRINIYLLQVNRQDIMVGIDNFFYRLLLKFYGSPLNDEGQAKFDQIRQIEYKLELAGNEYLTVETTNDIFTWIQFVLRQPDSFQQHYLECFIRDTFDAFDGFDEGVNISCPKGIYERFLLAIGDACVLYCTQYKKKNNKKKRETRRKQQKGGNKSLFHTCDNPIYRKLIRLFKKEVPDMNDFIKEWSAIFDCDRGQALTPLQLKQDFIEFIDRKYKRYGLDQMKTILASANDLEAAEIFKNKTF